MEALGPVPLVFCTMVLATAFNSDVGPVLILDGVAPLLN